jgi:Transglycosylase SLT domain
MRCRNLIAIVAAVAAWSFVADPGGAAPVSSKANPPAVAAQVRSLIRRNSKNTEIVTFADRGLAPVRIVRGGEKRPAGAVAHGSVATVTFAGNKIKPVTVLRGGSAVAAVVPTAALARGAEPGEIETVSFADPGERPVTVLRGAVAAWPDGDPFEAAKSAAFALFPAARGADLDRVAFAVDGAESSHGLDPAMWRAEFAGPQGPMQVSAAAATDLGGGDRFDLVQNRSLGRGYLASMFRRYGNWPDAIAAYNWGPGNMDGWIERGRPPAGLPLEVERYRDRVLRDGGIGRGPGQTLR